MKTVQKVYKR